MTKASIVKQLDRLLIPSGFVRQKATWNRASDEVVDVIDVQSSRFSSTVTINLGVLHRAVYKACWGRDIDGMVDVASCTVGARLGHLIDGKDRWWDTNEDITTSEILEYVDSTALPFLERMRSIEAMKQWLISTGLPSRRIALPALCLAALEAELGNKESACSILLDLERHALGAGKARAKEVADRLGCSPSN